MTEQLRQKSSADNQHPTEVARDVLAALEAMERGETVTIQVSKHADSDLLRFQMETDSCNHSIPLAGAGKRFQVVKVTEDFAAQLRNAGQTID